MAPPVHEVDDDADQHPDHEADPGQRGQVQHQPHAGQDRRDRQPAAPTAPGSRGAGRAGCGAGRSRPADTSTNANSVPTFTISSSLAIGNTDAATAISTPTSTVMRTGRAVRAGLGQRRAAAARRGDIANSTRVCPSISTITTVVSPASAPIEITLAAQSTPLAENAVARFAWPSPAVPQFGVVHHPGQHDGHRDVEHGDDGQRGQDAAWHVALRVLGLLGGGGDDVEADEREEHDRRAGQHAVPAVVAALAPGDQREHRLFGSGSAHARRSRRAG